MPADSFNLLFSKLKLIRSLLDYLNGNNINHA